MKKLFVLSVLFVLVACGGGSDVVEEIGHARDMMDAGKATETRIPDAALISTYDAETVPVFVTDVEDAAPTTVASDRTDDGDSEGTLGEQTSNDEMSEIAVFDAGETLNPIGEDPGETSGDTNQDVDAGDPTEEEGSYKLLIQFNGPPSGEAQAGANDYTAFLFSLTAPQEAVEVEALPVGISCDTGLIYGSGGTPYFTDIKVKDVLMGGTVVGPHELVPPTEQMQIIGSWFVFEELLFIPAGETRYLAVTLDTAVFEDAPGEFFGNNCRVTLGSLEGAALVGSPPEALSNEQINITADIAGNSFLVQPNAPTYDGDVTVALSPATPAGLTVPRNSTYVHMLSVTFTAGDVAGSTSALRLSRVGDGVGSDFANLFLFDENGNRLTQGRSVDPETDTVIFNGLDIIVPKNTTVRVSLVGTLSKPEILGGQHAFEIRDAKNVTLNGAGSVGGFFPVRGNTFTVSENEEVSVSPCEVIPYPVSALSVPSGAEVEISAFAFTASSRDVEVSRVALTQVGTILESGLSDFILYVGSTPVAAVITMVNGRIVLEFDSPLVIAAGTSSILKLRAFVDGESGRTIRTFIEYPVDLVARDSLYQLNAESIIDGFDGYGSSWVEVTVL